jgi:hypothetical protein
VNSKDELEFVNLKVTVTGEISFQPGDFSI